MFKQLLRTGVATRPSVRNTIKPISLQRFYSFDASQQPRIRINSEAPNFQSETTKGKIDFHEFIGDNWVVLFSHPADFTPVCTTELSAFAQLEPEFNKRGAKLIGLSTDDIESHNSWIKDIESYKNTQLNYPIIADTSKEIAFKYDMLTEEDFKNVNSGLVATVRAVYVIDPSKKVRVIITYPPTVGRNSAEILRVLDALQSSDTQGVAIPIDWSPGNDVIIPPTMSDKAAQEKFGDFVKHFNYLRTTSVKN